MGEWLGGRPLPAAKEEVIIMKILKNAFARVLWLAAFGLLLAGPVAAQFVPIEGQVIDLQGKPFPQVDINATSKEGALTLDTKTDKNGQFFVNLPRPGLWTITVKVKGQVAHSRDIIVRTTNNERIVINFKDLVAKEDAAVQEARKKQEEERSKFQGMKEHFDAGRASLDQANATKSQILKTPAADRGPLTEKLTAEFTAAINELEAAQRTAPPNEPNLHIVMSNLGQAYDLAGRYDDAVAAYTKASELKPDNLSYYQGLGTVLARAGKVAEAMATCEKSSKLPAPPGTTDATQVAANCYGNIGIVLQNSAKMKESIEPLKKATEINPSNADYWYLLGNGLLSSMEYKTEGGEMKMVPKPGTAEAFQKYLDLAPEGRFAELAKAGLTAIGTPVQTKVTNRKTKKP
jgi:tetratricopeptide (TPR) repeat protein